MDDCGYKTSTRSRCGNKSVLNDIEDSDDWSHLDDTYAVDENDRWEKYGDNVLVTLDPQVEVNQKVRH